MSKPFSNGTNVCIARQVLAECGIALGSDYHTLRSSAVDALMVWADILKYRKPKNANGSRARYFHNMLQRRAAGVTVDDARAAMAEAFVKSAAKATHV